MSDDLILENSYIDGSRTELSILNPYGDNYPGPPLPNNSSYIRLLELKGVHAFFGKSLLLKYHVTPLNEAPDFFALSYTWGAHSQNIKVKGLRVTDNLYSALLHLAEETPQLWWIDALCIDQDVHEKYEQVRIMKRIYEKAQQVRVWLGEPDVATLELLGKITRSIGPDLQQMFTEMSYTNEALEKLGLPKFDDPAWGTLEKILSRPYFSRIWVLQEFAMAKMTKKRVLVACGLLRFDWAFIAIPYQWIRTKSLRGVFRSQSFDPSQELTHASADDVIHLSLILESYPESLSLEYLLEVSDQLDATNPLDKIIALLGLVSEKDECVAKINIEYGQTVVDFYREVTGIIMTTNRSLNLLLLVEDRLLRNIQGLPSWVPDYTVRGRPRYRHKHFPSLSNPVDIEWSKGSNSLQIYGQIIDEVQFVSEEAPSIGRLAEETLLSWFKAAARFISADEWSWILSLAELDDMVNRDIEQFWRTMIGDFVADISPAPKEYRNHFAATIYEAFLEERSADGEWLLQLALALVHDAISENRLEDAKKDSLFIVLVQLLQEEQEKREVDIMNPRWLLPKDWVKPNDEDRYLHGPSGDRNAFIVKMAATYFGAQFFITQAGRMGRGPLSAQPGDQIAIVNNSEQLFMLRKHVPNFQFVGECYVHGLMRGEGREEVGIYQKLIIV